MGKYQGDYAEVFICMRVEAANTISGDKLFIFQISL